MARRGVSAGSHLHCGELVDLSKHVDVGLVSHANASLTGRIIDGRPGGSAAAEQHSSLRRNELGLEGVQEVSLPRTTTASASEARLHAGRRKGCNGPAKDPDGRRHVPEERDGLYYHEVPGTRSCTGHRPLGSLLLRNTATRASLPMD